ncbi:four-carbon acid sugar kinase family protein, partial [Salmonella enterica]|uniref:four-carbon acid sugar kinase family protein n=1 Tax=Salmonella enterica TaxID=28901 RepID=UPI00398C7628
MLKIGVIADDFTGATDIASVLVENGMPTVQINEVPTGTQPEACAAAVISLQTCSSQAQEARKQSLAALVWFQKPGCPQGYFKHCPT